MQIQISKKQSNDSLDVEAEDEFLLSGEDLNVEAEDRCDDDTIIPTSNQVYNLDHVNHLREMCSHIPPDDWNTSSRYNPGLVRIYQAYLDFLDKANIESLRLVPGALLYLVKPVLPWYSPDQSNLRLCALVMHYLTTTEANGYKNDETLHTAHSIKTDGHLRSSCWQLLRASIGDEGYFSNSIKVEVCPVAYPYGKDINQVFADAHESEQLLNQYSKFLETVVDVASRVHLCSKTVAKKMADYGIENFHDYFLSNRDKFFSLMEDEYKTCAHPEALLNVKFWNGHHINHASDWDNIFTQIRKFHGEESPCQIAHDLVRLIPGSEGHNLLLRKQHEACVRGGKASHATDDGMRPGQHVKDDGKFSMASEDRGRKRGIACNHRQSYATQKARGNGIPGMTSKQCSARMMVRPNNGTSHLNPNADRDFENHCNMARTIFEKVSSYMI